MARCGIVWISPSDPAVPSGRMVDSDNSLFVATCQQNGPLDHTGIASAEAALAWGRERAERIVIRLGHTEDTCFTDFKAIVSWARRPRVRSLCESRMMLPFTALQKPRRQHLGASALRPLFWPARASTPRSRAT